MNGTVEIPLWIAVILGLVTIWVVLDRLLMPSVRWFFRRRVNIMIKEVNQRLDLELPTFKLTERRILIDRLIYDPAVLQAVEEYCAENNAPTKIAIEKVERYAREIVPSFNAVMYFRFGSRIARSLARLLYRVRMGYADEEALSKIDPRSSVVFVMNHRSNMDYILTAYLAINRMALSFAVGEWARITPVQQLVRSMGAYFVRRGSGNALYRKVLARYVQMATEGGVVQAVFPEGGLTRDGLMRPPRVGLLAYMLRTFKPDEGRDLVFIPVGINYDRVVEDRSQILGVTPGARRKKGWAAISTAFRFFGRNISQMMRGEWYRFGYAAANFGTPISMREYVTKTGIDFRTTDSAGQNPALEQLAAHLLDAVGQVIPVLPVALVSHVLVGSADLSLNALELRVQIEKLVARLKARGVLVYLPRDSVEYTIHVGMRMLTLRHIVTEEDELYKVASGELALVRYYANSIAHLTAD